MIPEELVARWASLVPGDHSLLGIDEDTAIVRDGTWRVVGRGRVIVSRDGARAEHRAGGLIGPDVLP
jgi:cyanophycinase-like exopeptidase